MTVASIALEVSPDRHPLDAIFVPRSVALIGATDREGSVGRTLLTNLLQNPFGGTVFPINPKRSNVLGVRAYPSIAEVPETVDLAVIATPAATVPDLIRDCGQAGVRGAIVLSAGFKEIGPAGIELEKRLLTEARRYNMRVVGPNCLGVMNPISGLNATFASAMARPGNVAFLSQSGAMCTAILDWSFREQVGFSSFVSIGSMLDVGWGDLIEYLGDDPRTHTIAIYMESVGDARAFLSAAREVALQKPIMVIKVGRTEAAAQAAASHTGSLSGSDAVLDAAFRRSGVLRVETIEDLFDMTEVLAKQPRPRGRKLIVLTNAGGPGVLAADEVVSGGGDLAELSPETIERLDQVLPPSWSRRNPIDILGDADPDRYSQALEIAAADPNGDGLLTILTPQAMTDPTQIAERLRPYAHCGKPILASWMGGSAVAAGEAILNQAGIFTLPYPDAATRVFNYMWRYSYNLRGLYETPNAVAGSFAAEPDRAAVTRIIQQAQAVGRNLLTEFEAKQILAAYGIPVVETRIATKLEEAVEIANDIGYPVALKLYSETITHKSDVGGVRLNLQNANEVRWAYLAIVAGVAIANRHKSPQTSSYTEEGDADPQRRVLTADFLGVTVQPMLKLDGYELILGSSVDPQFGPVLLFGLGGQLVEVFRDRALGLPPLNTTLARRMMEQTRIYKALQGVRGRAPVDLAALEQLLVRFSQLVVEQPWIKEIDINPLLAREAGQAVATGTTSSLIALDARVVLHPPMDPATLPRPAIRPYPIQYATPWTLRDGTTVNIRPIRPEDEPPLVRFHESLSEQTVYLRYFHALKLSQRISHERLSRICFIDYDREMALVAEGRDPSEEREILGVSRISKLHGSNEAEFAMLIRDRYQNQGLGTELLQRLVAIARDEKIDRLRGEILPNNAPMRHLCEKLGFQIQRAADITLAVLEL
ncbi:MAG: bifunctional acetate--CoA ligase family protein/GNAT family N-acetyltransferase [Limnothrix sp.]|uniref:bifunctional acetate--CoA ligase family protein/GNAT family N-acetyltransferase n=1 Tax=unclassified Limnothrix TaxID=2632864 RepID=UPI00167FF586|nr:MULTISPECIES: bifunctional acetate--CoA ligase family protein/GNAT family N-acetyltransferase [unclassified Limnothrix]MEB3117546.1 bifunctional acetate--CoA ligase family protein/GNAT family N-acetyltransferase [Limnothrix sp.]MBD2162237.1 bifunctional acetate--CoA ligase family protein/GNAT family N-acetyltransferase [Limnothrix sp. FACHB-1083]MBD2193206.1 bifunctional acetate--CoA ligase family protein/GNAT family N-acetyltransferase [Limnothrix sp. FACHB-1088]MBD2555074.1 bifunctional ac